MAKERLVSLDWLKCLAALLIVNSHIGVCYGKYAALATGGAIGNAIFFFCSGYALSLGRFDRFDNWYKRRLFRIYPSVVARVLVIAPIIAVFTALLSGVDCNSLNVSELMDGGGAKTASVSISSWWRMVFGSDSTVLRRSLCFA